MKVLNQNDVKYWKLFVNQWLLSDDNIMYHENTYLIESN